MSSDRFYFFCYIFCTFLNFSASRIPPQHLNVGNARSPLDDGDYAHYYDDNSLSNPKPQSLIPSMSEFAKLPICQKPCTKYLSETFGIVMKASNHYDRFYGVCEKYNETLVCMDTEGGCASRELFNVFTSGLRYMCVDQRDAFEATIECVDAAASQITAECNQQCNTRGKLANWAMQSGILDGFRTGEKVPLLNPEMMRGLMQDGCELADCHLGCMKTKFNNRCEGHAGNLISEMLVRPIGETQQGQSFKVISSIMGLFMPNQCQFMVNEEQLTKFRIDPKVDEEVREMYKNRKETELVESFVEQEAEPRPSIIPDVEKSPLDEVQDSHKSPSENPVSTLADDTVDYPDVEVVQEPTPIIAVKEEELHPEHLNRPDLSTKNEPSVDEKSHLEGQNNLSLVAEDETTVEKEMQPEIVANDHHSEVEQVVPNHEIPIMIPVDVSGLQSTSIPLGIDPTESIELAHEFYRRMKVRCSIKREFRRFYSGCNN